jgi:hypothetical protein
VDGPKGMTRRHLLGVSLASLLASSLAPWSSASSSRGTKVKVWTNAGREWRGKMREAFNLYPGEQRFTNRKKDADIKILIVPQSHLSPGTGAVTYTKDNGEAVIKIGDQQAPSVTLVCHELNHAYGHHGHGPDWWHTGAICPHP